MKKKSIIYAVSSLVFLAFFVLLILLFKTVYVKKTGAIDPEMGLAGFNTRVMDFPSVSKPMRQITLRFFRLPF